MREVKIRAIHEHKILKDAIAEFIRKGNGCGQKPPAKAPKPVKRAVARSRRRNRSGDRVGPRLGDAPR
jgi:hypothetical protein